MQEMEGLHIGICLLRKVRATFPKIGKVLVVTLFGVTVNSCNTDAAPDCLQSAGNLVRDEVSISDFTKITVFENISLVLKQGEQTKVTVETGEFLLNEVSATVEGDRLVLRDTNDCNYFRDYGSTTVFVTAPNIVEIRSSTGWPIRSDGVLSYPSLTLLSESFVNPESETTDGAFDLEVANENLNLVVNGISYFKLRGTTGSLNLTIAAGDSRIEAQGLIANTVGLNHRGSNDMLINPQQSLSGVIRGTGDVVSFTRPDVVDVEVLFNGRLFFRE
ncbi:MAG: head GIN domain-containing protein [Flavobacteriaceae bacterium]